MLEQTVATNQLSIVISQAAAPAFVLGAVASFLSVLVSHMSRIVDRARAISAVSEDGSMKPEVEASLARLMLRATLVNRAIFWAVATGICCCFLMIVAFGAAYLGLKHEP